MYKCINGIDYEECENLVHTSGEMCDHCLGHAYDLHIEGLRSGDGINDIKDRMDEARRLK